MADPSEIVGLVATGGGSTLLAKYLWDRFLRGEQRVEKRAEHLEEKQESALEQKVDLLLTKMTNMEANHRVSEERAIASAAVVAEVKARIDGVSSNHGGRIGSNELEIAKLGERVSALERRGKR